MASGQAEQEDAVPLEDLIYNLRRDIEIDCEILNQRVEVIGKAIKTEEFRTKYWEDKINKIRNGLITMNIDELKELREKCQTVSTELEEFSRKLS